MASIWPELSPSGFPILRLNKTAANSLQRPLAHPSRFNDYDLPRWPPAVPFYTTNDIAITTITTVRSLTLLRRRRGFLLLFLNFFAIHTP